MSEQERNPQTEKDDEKKPMRPGQTGGMGPGQGPQAPGRPGGQGNFGQGQGGQGNDRERKPEDKTR